MSSLRPHPDLTNLLIDTYKPCLNFGVCREAQWRPESGHVPRGFLGATGELSEVQVILVFSEPGRPQHDESYSSKLTAVEIMDASLHYVYDCFKSGTDLFHRNVRWFMSELYPDLTLDQQLRRVWLTEGRLCSIENEIGSTKDRTCANTYLHRQIRLLEKASVVAFGGKARYYLQGVNVDHLEAYALAPPGANHRPAKPSWQKAIDEIKRLHPR